MVKTLFLNKLGYDLLKILLSCIGIFVFIFFIRYFIPSYNGESFYFSIKESGTEEQNNQKRIKIAAEILENFDWKILKEKPRMNLSISLIAADRKNGYITQSMAFLLTQIESWEKVPIISICNVEDNIFDELKLFTHKLQIRSINKENNIAFDLTEDDGRLKKEANDYWNCLNAAYSSNHSTDFILLIEDDAVPIPYFGMLIESLLNQLNSLDYIDFVKLFHPWRLRKIPFMFQATSLSIAFGLTVSYFVFRRFSIIAILIISIFMYSCLRQSFYSEIFADIRFHFSSSAYITPSESCCTPGVLFRSTSIPSMLKYFKEQNVENGHAKDHILDESPFTGKATDFNYFVHIGHFSSVRQKVIPLESLLKN
uniref:Uncharacterized protein n=1 Tax=Panagrolaimus sp. PS1159 TaxID=55785 RepID=A0AC35F914_9BILA